MLLKSITLHNFRQFRDESIEFAQGDDGKNVTIIIGENAAGKTTFAQAFFWCMYGTTNFIKKNLLNSTVAKNMRPSHDESVSVELVFKHGHNEYTLTRNQVYKKDYNNNVKADSTTFDISYKNTDGQIIFIKKDLDSTVKSILPRELSQYFFFDGERIEKMSKDITMNNKSTDFSDAVNGLLGLNGFLSAIDHFNPRSKKSVIGSYDSSFDSKSNVKISEYTKKINECNTTLDNLDKRLKTLNEEKNNAEALRDRSIEEIKQYAEGEKAQKEKESLQQDIKTMNSSLSSSYKDICNYFNTEMKTFFSKSLIMRAFKLLEGTDYAGKDIPSVNDKTIHYLLNQKICICGTHLDEGSMPYNHVKEYLNYVPPVSISNMISLFKKEATTRANIPDELISGVRSKLQIISETEDRINQKLDSIFKIDKKLGGKNVEEQVRTLNMQIKTCNDLIQKSLHGIDECNREIGATTTNRNRYENERRELTLLDENNRKIETYKAYAERIYNELVSIYSFNEAEIRNRLQQTINDIFKRIFDGKLVIDIDEKYHISVYADKYEGDVETSTAQSISVIFAFITGIIKLAKENRNANDENAKLLSSEPYPLVMDAPLSALDKRRIKAVCDALPETAEQVIIFIKDVDGEIAEQYMQDKIGCRRRFNKINDFETTIS